MLGSTRWHRRLLPRRDRLALVADYSIPHEALAAYSRANGPLDAGLRDTLTDATRQWCRLRVRAPRTTLVQPSRAVEDLWHLAAAYGGTGHQDLLATAFGQQGAGQQGAVQPVPAPRPGGTLPQGRLDPKSTDATALRATYLLACQDEGRAPPHIPLLFQVDRLLGRVDRRTYMPNCGEARYCAAAEGTVCLQHLTAPPHRQARWGRPPDANLDAEAWFGTEPGTIRRRSSRPGRYSPPDPPR